MQGWSRLKQQTREAISGSKDSKTEIPNDINSLLLKSAGVNRLYDELISKALVEFPEHKLKTKNADDPLKAQPLFIFGQSMEALSAEYHQDPSIRQFFMKSSDCMSSLAKAKADLDYHVHEKYIEPKRSVMFDRVDNAVGAFEKLKTRRLDLDSKKHRLKGERKTGDESGKMKKYELEVQTAQQRFDTVVDDIRNLLTPVADDAQMARFAQRQTADVLVAMREYYRQCYEIMCQLDDQIHFDQMNHSSSPKCLPSQPPKAHSPQNTISSEHSASNVSLHSTPSRTSLTQPKPMYSQVLPNQAVPTHTSSSTPNIPAGGVPVMMPRISPQLKPKPSVGALARGPPPPVPVNMRTPPRPAVVERCKALYDFSAVESGDLSINSGDVIEVLSKNGEWWEGVNTRTREKGNFPCNYVELL